MNKEGYGRLSRPYPSLFIIFELGLVARLGWEGAVIEEVPLRFEIRDGWLHEVIDPNGRKTKVVTQVDGERFNELWFKTVTGF